MTDKTIDIQSRLLSAGRYNRWIADTLRPWLAPRHADFGAGRANVTEHLLDRELVVMVEPVPEFVEILKERFKDDSRVKVFQGDATDARWPSQLGPLELGSASMINVLEHIADDVGTLRNLAACLAPGGRIALFVPAHQWLYGAMDRADGHYRRYTRRSLRWTIESAGLRVEHLRPFNIAGIPAWAYQSVIRKREVVAEDAYGAFDRVVPMLRAVERSIPLPIGLSLVAVARKR